jgi:hypothetical protein
MRFKLFFRTFTFLFPVAILARFFTQIGNDFHWDWARWNETITIANVVVSASMAGVIAWIWLRTIPKDEVQ